MKRLEECGCVPLSYDGQSTTMVHGFGCSMFPEGTKLTGAEMARWRGHPAGSNVAGASRADRIPDPVATSAPATRPRKVPERWHTGPNNCPDCAGIEV